MAASDINDYVFYKIVCIDENIELCYVGSTKNLRRRKNDHKCSCTNPNSREYNQKKYQTIRANGGWENFKLIEIGKREQITEKEAQYIEEEYRVNLKANMNRKKCYTTKEIQAQYYRDYQKKNYAKDPEKHKKYAKEYTATHKEEKREYRETHKKEINEKGKTKVMCECGCEIQNWGLNHHRKTKKHLNLMKNNNE